jgi:hypothetical protein
MAFCLFCILRVGTDDKSIMHDVGEICTLKRKLMGFFFQNHLMICSLWSTFFGPQNPRFHVKSALAYDLLIVCFKTSRRLGESANQIVR